MSPGRSLVSLFPRLRNGMISYQQQSSFCSLHLKKAIGSYPNQFMTHKHASTGKTTNGSVKRHNERRLLRFPQMLLYEVVSDVSQYSQFVPYCKTSTIIEHSDTSMIAELEVGFQMLSERYLSFVSMENPVRITAESRETQLFHHLLSEWRFSPSASDPNGATWVTFSVEFQFKSSLYNEISEMFLQEVVKKMVKAFENRCQMLHSQRKQ